MIGFRLADGTDIRRDLADLHFIDAGNGDFRLRGAIEFDAVRLGKIDRVGLTDEEYDLVPLLCDLITDAVDHEAFRVSLGNADDHVMQKRSV